MFLLRMKQFPKRLAISAWPHLNPVAVRVYETTCDKMTKFMFDFCISLDLALAGCKVQQGGACCLLPVSNKCKAPKTATLCINCVEKRQRASRRVQLERQRCQGQLEPTVCQDNLLA